LKSVQVILAEDTRHTRACSIARHCDALVSCHKFNEAARLESVLARIKRGRRLPVTDSGMRACQTGGACRGGCRRAGLPVTVVPARRPSPPLPRYVLGRERFLL
jgi:16S rRNA C1402 (ribose-2'-O) methylase RsmI